MEWTLQGSLVWWVSFDEHLYNGTEIEPIQRLNILNTIQRLKNSKAPGIDGLTTKLFKYCCHDLDKALQNIILSI